jgi:hypothetical protein
MGAANAAMTADVIHCIGEIVPSDTSAVDGYEFLIRYAKVSY